MKNLNALKTGLFIFGLMFAISCSKNDKKELPNIILVITDDQGYGDLGCTGNTIIQTPNLDDFCNESVLLTDFHVSTTCAPTRGALLTGRHTNRLNVFHTISGRSLLYEEESLLPEILSANGYTTGMFGKWHLGDNYPFRPGDRGFDEVVRHGGGGIGQLPDYWGNDYFDDYYWHNGSLQAYEGYCTDVFFNEALRFIEENQDQPFFCYLSTNAPHGPYNVPEEYLDLYSTNPELNEKEQRFYGMITNIDDNFALLRQKLQELELEENTILIFMTDNGTAAGHGVYNAGMKGNKGSEYEGGHRVPFMIRWPDGNIGGGKKVDHLLAHFDLLPTLLDILELDYVPENQFDGVSMLPLLLDNTSDWKSRILYVDTQRRLNLVKNRKYSVMKESWRLVNGTELYNIDTDPGQANNIIADHPEIAQGLLDGYETWWKSILSEGVDERYAYIIAGTEHENPVRMCSHDLLTPDHGNIWHQSGAALSYPTTGIYKIELASPGSYAFSLRRFPRESELAINAEFPAAPVPRRLQSALPESVSPGISEAYLYIADFTGRKKVSGDDAEIVFEAELSEGKYDMTAEFRDEAGVRYPAYYLYIEKLKD